MFWLRLIYTRLYGLLRKDRIEQEMEEEMRFHLRILVQEKIERGMRPDEAEREARRRFGNVGHIKDLGRDIKGGGFMETILQDLRYGARMLMRNPGFTLIAVITLALGIGANAAIFSVINSVLLNPLPYEQADRLVMVRDNNAGLNRQHEGPSPGNYHDLRGAPGIFESSAAWFVTARTLIGEQDAEQVQCALVTPDFFTTLRVRAASGRVFSAAETQGAAMTPATQYAAGDRLIVISDALWRRRFGAASDTVGSTITINGTDWRVQGIMPPRFALPDREVDL
jgi:hypothetical protein